MREGGGRDGDLGEDLTGSDPVGRARAHLERALGGRPLSVYGVLAAGVLVLVVLLVIIWLTATGGEDNAADDQCFGMTAEEAQAVIERGEVTSIRITTARERSDGPELPIAAQLDLSDGGCRYLPEGATNRNGTLLVLGTADFYNRNHPADERIRIRDQEQANVPAEVFATATPTPTVGPTETPVPPTAAPTLPPASPTAPPPTEAPVPSATAAPPPSPAAAGSPEPDPLPALQTETP